MAQECPSSLNILTRSGLVWGDIKYIIGKQSSPVDIARLNSARAALLIYIFELRIRSKNVYLTVGSARLLIMLRLWTAAE